MRDLKLHRLRVDVSGGVIALGHPIGATGGMTTAVVIERL
jgi:acetyl-CoA acetyltransferase